MAEKRTKPSRHDLLAAIGSLQGHIGMIQGIMHDDKDPSRMDKLEIVTKNAFDLCIKITAFDKQRSGGQWDWSTPDLSMFRLDGPKPGKLYAPWTDKQVELLNTLQNNDTFHGYTCGICGAHLTATLRGWVCPTQSCDYTQLWAHNPEFYRE